MPRGQGGKRGQEDEYNFLLQSLAQNDGELSTQITASLPHKSLRDERTQAEISHRRQMTFHRQVLQQRSALRWTTFPCVLLQ